MSENAKNTLQLHSRPSICHITFCCRKININYNASLSMLFFLLWTVVEYISLIISLLTNASTSFSSWFGGRSAHDVIIFGCNNKAVKYHSVRNEGAITSAHYVHIIQSKRLISESVSSLCVCTRL